MKNINIENINIDNYTNSGDAYRDYLAVQEIVDNMNVLNPRIGLYQSIANDIYEKCVALQYFEELLDSEQLDSEQSDNEQSDKEQSDKEQSDNDNVNVFVGQIRSVVTSDDLIKIYSKFENYINKFGIFSAKEMRAIYTAFNEKENEFCIEL